MRVFATTGRSEGYDRKIASAWCMGRTNKRQRADRAERDSKLAAVMT
jgi:hypothetical protein